MTIYVHLASREKTPATKKVQNRRRPLPRTAIYQEPQRWGDEDHINRHEGMTSSIYHQNLSQVPLLTDPQKGQAPAKSGSVPLEGAARRTTVSNSGKAPPETVIQKMDNLDSFFIKPQENPKLLPELTNVKRGLLGQDDSQFNHHYHVETTIGPERDFDKIVELRLRQQRFQVPGGGTEPVRNGGKATVPIIGTVEQTVSADGTTVTNTTVPGQHQLHAGTVTRTLVREGGNTVMISDGIGTGPLPWMNTVLAEPVWGKPGSKVVAALYESPDMALKQAYETDMSALD